MNVSIGSYEQQCRKSAAMIRARLMGSKKTKVLTIPPVRHPDDWPFWMMNSTTFDAHVRDWREYVTLMVKTKYITVPQLIRMICEKNGFDFHAIMSKSRKYWVIEQKQRVWIELSARGMSLTQIANAFGQDHTTVLSGLKKLDPENKFAKRVIAKRDKPRKQGDGTIERFDTTQSEKGARIRAMYEDGESYLTIGLEIGVSHETVRKYVKLKGLVKGGALPK